METVTESTMIGNTLFPVFLKIDQGTTLVVGGGNVGLEKLTALLKNSPEARIMLVGKTIQPAIQSLAAEHPHVLLVERGFLPEDLEGKRMVICATDDPWLHRDIRAQAHERGLLVNVADTPELCDFYLGSIVQKGDLKIAISTNGKSPTIAKRLKATLQ
ncbi:MAG TPA: siroheme synthase, partial [Saprospirales bacterium]|nr:siroheme synthase [Saprospirales bacterium]